MLGNGLTTLLYVLAGTVFFWFAFMVAVHCCILQVTHDVDFAFFRVASNALILVLSNNMEGISK